MPVDPGSPVPPNPWSDPQWDPRPEIIAHLTAAGRPPIGDAVCTKAWGRSCIHRVPTADGTVWVKHTYRLPPGEERVLAALSPRWPRHVPTVVATWDRAVAMLQLPGPELTPKHRASDWVATATRLGEITAGERRHAAEWLALGVRDRRPGAWARAVTAMLASPVAEALDAPVRRVLDAALATLIARYAEGFGTATLVPQDSGCCNVALGRDGPVLFDWSDVVVGDPVYACDRLLDQTPAAMRDAVIDAFLGPLRRTVASFKAARRLNVLHEALRYHDELAWLAPDDPAHASLTASVQSQLTVVSRHL
ncbi:MAG: hypothetical protein ACI8PZ_006458 [Myxococcota bacterium]|jgi:hypothetical protein